MKNATNPTEWTLGLTVQAAAFLVVVIVFFHWNKTAVRRPRVPGAITTLAISWIGMGVWGFLAFAFIGMQIPALGSTLPWIYLGYAIVPFVIGVGLLRDARWSRSAAKIISIPISLSWPIGTLLAFATWWWLNPNAEQNPLMVSAVGRPDDQIEPDPPMGRDEIKIVEREQPKEKRQPGAAKIAFEAASSNPFLLIAGLILVSIVVGVALDSYELDPTVVLIWLWRYMLFGAFFVIPLWLIVRWLTAVRSRSGK